MATQASDSIKQKPRTASADELAVIAQRAQAFTNASGTAIAISEGSSDEIVCRARSGSSAPDVGTALRIEGTFTGMCIQTGKEMRCDDAETDTRVDTTAIRALGIRSMVVTPIRNEGKVVGVLAVFAPTAHAFTITHVAVLKTMADQISALLQKEPRTKDEPAIANAVPLPAPVPKPVKPAVPLPPPVVIKPAAAPALAASAAAAVTPARSSVSSAPKIEPHAMALAADISVPVPFPKREERHDYKPASSPAHKASFGTLDAVAGEPSRSSATKFIFVGLVAMAAIGAFGWYFVKTHKSAPSAAAQNAVQNPVQTAVPTTAQPQNSASVTPVSASVSVDAATNSDVAEPPARISVTPTNAKPDLSEKNASKRSEPKKKEQQPSAPVPTPTTVAVGAGPSKIVSAAPVDQSADLSPSLAVGDGASSGLASLARPVDNSAPAPAATTAAKSDLVNAKPIHTVPADYPELAKSRRVSGLVVVRVTVGKDGKVRNPVFVSGPVIFRDAAFDSIKQWTFKPAELNGQPIEQQTEIRMNFHPTN